MWNLLVKMVLCMMGCLAAVAVDPTLQLSGVTTVYVEVSGPCLSDGHFDAEGGSRLRPVRVGDLPLEVQAGAVPLNVSLLLPPDVGGHDVVDVVPQGPPAPPHGGAHAMQHDGAGLD